MLKLTNLILHLITIIVPSITFIIQKNYKHIAVVWTCLTIFVYDTLKASPFSSEIKKIITTLLLYGPTWHFQFWHPEGVAFVFSSARYCMFLAHQASRFYAIFCGGQMILSCLPFPSAAECHFLSIFVDGIEPLLVFLVAKKKVWKNTEQFYHGVGTAKTKEIKN